MRSATVDNFPVQAITVAIISDTHTVLDPRIAEAISRADIAIHAGDIGDVNVLSAMRPKTGRVIAVTGNNDHPIFWPVDQTEVLESMPEIARFELPGGSVAIEHGHRHESNSPDHHSLREAHPDAKLVVYGHTHHQVIDDISTPWVVNPGAAGATRTHGGPSYLLLTASEQHWRIESFRFSDDS
jgi:putative phosphoesterase